MNCFTKIGQYISQDLKQVEKLIADKQKLVSKYSEDISKYENDAERLKKTAIDELRRLDSSISTMRAELLKMCDRFANKLVGDGYKEEISTASKTPQPVLDDIAKLGLSG